MRAKFSLFVVTAALCLGADAPLPVRGIHIAAPKPDEMPACLGFIREGMPREGANLLVLEFNYRYQYTKRPEVVDSDALTREQVKEIVAACRASGVKLIPMINMLGHQSWSKTTFGLLRAHPEFDETPGKYPDNEGIYCRSYCPLHPGVHDVVFDLMDELAEVSESDAFHIGMDEVFLLGENDCPRCKGKDKADLFAGEVRALHDHLAKSGRTMWMWGDRFLDGEVTGIGKWEASLNSTAPSIRQIPKDIVISDWHYEWPVPTATYFAMEGFPVVYSPWRKPGVALGQLELVRQARNHSPAPVAGRMLGMLQTTWCGMGPFVKAYFGEGETSRSAIEAALCFRELFNEIRKGGLR
ncbi:MAG TPA: family 20 glycosylhydrolase [Bryobacteraceae bacterium]|nr:family 20 glycosylhydrolase [Bryobacteraceae bacterium]